MKICILTHSFPRFKADTVTPFMENLATGLGEKGHEVFVLTPYDVQIQTLKRGPFTLISYKYIYPDSLHILGFSRTFQKMKSMSLLTYLISPLMYLFGMISLLKLVRREKIDIISSHWIIPNGFIARLVKFVTRVPYTATIPGADVYMGGKNELFRQMVGFSTKGADYIISDSAYYISQLNDLGFYPKKVSIIRYGVNTQDFKPRNKDKNLLKEMGIGFDNKVVLGVGRMVVQKGFIYLLRAFKQIYKKIPKSKLIIVGDGYEKKRLEREAKKLKIEDKVILPGTILYNQLSKFYNIADCFVVPSFKDREASLDASPVSMMEAMACGVPVVATRFAASKDLVVGGKTGYLVQERNSNQIANALVKLLKKNDKAKIKDEVRKIAVNNFSVEQISKKYIEIFEKVLTPQE